MNMTVSTINSPSLTQEPLLLRQQHVKLKPIIEKIDSLAKASFLRIVIPTLKNLCREIKQQSYSRAFLKILTQPVLAAILSIACTSIGFLTLYASFLLLISGNSSDALSSDVNTRVAYANNITNCGALFVAVADIPAIAYILYTFVLKDAYLKAVHDLRDVSYRLCVDNDPSLTEEMHEALYLHHISKLENLGIEHFYKNPNIRSVTGKKYKDLEQVLDNIDKEIEKASSFSDLKRSWVEVVKKSESSVADLARLIGCLISLLFMGLATFLVIENIILLLYTPVRDLFSGDSIKENNEAFYLTQMGSFFSSLTAFGVCSYVIFHLLRLEAANNQRIREKIENAYEKYNPNDPDLANALFHIIEKKLLKIS